MKILAINTANPNKLKEFEKLFGKHQITLQSTYTDVPEIQSDPITVIVHKASQVREGVLVEDTSLEIDEASVGVNIRWQLDDMPKYIGQKAVWRVLLAYRQKDQVYVFEGKISGRIVSPRGDGAFGFDPYFLPDGSKYTLGESKPDEVNARAKAVEAFVQKKPIGIHAPLFDWKGPWQ